MNQCPDCQRHFSRRDVMLRHRRNIHENINNTYTPPPLNNVYTKAYPPPPPAPPPKRIHSRCRRLVKCLYFRSSMTVVGPTSSGKTWWLYRLLRNLDTMYAREPPMKIVCCSGVYQPLRHDGTD